MWNKKFLTETQLVIYLNEKQLRICKDPRSVKSWIYRKCLRNQVYQVDEINYEGEILNQWLYKYLDNGVIFTKKIFDKWKKMLEDAKNAELSLWD